MIGAGLLAGNANVIMQLARPGVGYGVVESKVDTGNLFKHPVKRGRTTITYLAVAALGTEEERKAYRKAVNASHAQVRSTASSPVKYNAFDPELQLWVAACLYKGLEDVVRTFGPPVDEETWESLYRASAVFGTTLQMPASLWPADRAAFESYWNESLARISIDDAVREHLYAICMLRHVKQPLSFVFGPLHRFVTTGFLPPRFRAEMRMAWSAKQQLRFDRLMAVNAWVVRRSPRVLRHFPYNWAIWDLRRRIKTGRPLV